MTDISTRYMGLDLKSPIIVGSCSLSNQVDRIKAAEDSGAGALVIKSLFEEQIQGEAYELENLVDSYANMIDEALSFHPAFEHGGPAEHLMWVRNARQAVSMPLIASLNAVSPGEWSSYAVQLAEEGVDAIELNFFSVITDFKVADADVIKSMLETVQNVISKVKIPVAVKLSPYFSSPGNVAMKLDDAGVDALVVFNRFANFGIDVDAEEIKFDMAMSVRDELSHPLRWISLLSGHTKGDLCGGTGIHTGEDVVKMLLAGATTVQVVTALYLNSMNYIESMNTQLKAWMTGKGYQKLDDFRGKASRARSMDPYAYERGQYIQTLLGFD